MNFNINIIFTRYSYLFGDLLHSFNKAIKRDKILFMPKNSSSGIRVDIKVDVISR